MADPNLKEELHRMEGEYEPLLPIERKLIFYSFFTGVVSLCLLVIISRFV